MCPKYLPSWRRTQYSVDGLSRAGVRNLEPRSPGSRHFKVWVGRSTWTSDAVENLGWRVSKSKCVSTT